MHAKRERVRGRAYRNGEKGKEGQKTFMHVAKAKLHHYKGKKEGGSDTLMEVVILGSLRGRRKPGKKP